MTKKFKAVKTEWTGVFRKTNFFGDGRYMEVLLPSYSDAKDYIAKKKASGIYSDDDFMLETVKVTIPAWDGAWVPANSRRQNLSH